MVVQSTKKPNRLIFGTAKYAALHLMLCRWMRIISIPTSCTYVTLGGTELRDIESLDFVDSALIKPAITFELDSKRYKYAQKAAHTLHELGIDVDVRRADMFNYQRESDQPHIFFFDFEGICAWSDYHIQFGHMFQDLVMREGDTLFLTSYLGRHPGWPRVYEEFAGEFLVLGVKEVAKKKEIYTRSHVAFTLFRALKHVNLTDDLLVAPIGAIRYRDTSPMLLCGFTVSGGSTDFSSLASVRPYYDLTARRD